MDLPLSFVARPVTGRGRGRVIGAPTINLDLADVPSQLREGIYACMVTLDGEAMQAAMHYGPRPVFKDTVACEVHLLNRTVDAVPGTITVAVAAYLREVRDFPSTEALMTQIADDVSRARAILDAHA